MLLKDLQIVLNIRVCEVANKEQSYEKRHKTPNYDWERIK